MICVLLIVTTRITTKLKEKRQNVVGVSLGPGVTHPMYGAPSSATRMFTRRQDVAPRDTRLARSAKIHLPKVRLASTQRAFSYRAAAKWNSLPEAVLHSPSIGQFRGGLKDLRRDALAREWTKSFTAYALSTCYVVSLYSCDCVNVYLYKLLKELCSHGWSLWNIHTIYIHLSRFVSSLQKISLCILRHSQIFRNIWALSSLRAVCVDGVPLFATNNCLAFLVPHLLHVINPSIVSGLSGRMENGISSSYT